MNIALIVAAGVGKRFGGKTPKLLLPIHGKPLLYYSVMSFYDHENVDRIVIVVNGTIKKQVERMIKTYFPGNSKKFKLVMGGASRSESVLNGISSLRAKKKDFIMIHNGANPLVSYDEISKCFKKAKAKGACIVAHPVTSTLKEIKRSKVAKTHDRTKFANAETPQIFQYEVLVEALKKAGDEYLEMTDEAMLVEAAGHHVYHVDASDHNRKVTKLADYERVKHILGDLPEDFVVGLGQDSHEFESKKGLILGGLKFPKEKKLKANSDGDVIIHALCTALLQAIGDKSLGVFADKYCLKKGIKDSRIYLEKVLKKVKRKGYKLNNLGVMLECKTPKIDSISPRIKANLARLAGLPVHRVGITATSGEKLTSFGKGKGIQCFCIVSLKKI